MELGVRAAGPAGFLSSTLKAVSPFGCGGLAVVGVATASPTSLSTFLDSTPPKHACGRPSFFNTQRGVAFLAAGGRQWWVSPLHLLPPLVPFSLNPAKVHAIQDQPWG